MVTIKRDPFSGQIVCSTRGEFDDRLLAALLDAIALAPDDAALTIDLSFTGTIAANRLEALAGALTAREGTVSFRNCGPWHAPVFHAIDAC